MNLLKQMALNAKMRMSKGKYDNTQKTNKRRNNISSYISNGLSSSSTQITIKEMDTDIDKNFSEKVFMLLDNDEETFSPLGNLVDKSAFENMNGTEKERYIFNISDKYNFIKSEYNKTRHYI